MIRYHSFRSFIRYVGHFKAAFLATSLAFAIADILLAVIPWLIGQLVATITHSGNNMPIWFWALGLVVCSVGHDALWRTGEILHLTLLNPRAQRYDDLIFQAIINHSYGYFVDKSTGKISSYANNLGREFRELLDNFCFSYVNLFVELPVIVIIMFSVNLPTGIIFLSSLIAMFFIGRKLARIAATAERKQADMRSSVDGYVVDAIANFVSVKSFGSERFEAAHIYRKRSNVVTASHIARKKDMIFWGVMSLFVRWVIWPSTILLNVYLFIHHQISLAQLSTFLSVIVIFSNFIWEVIWNVSQFMMRIARTEEAYHYLFGTQDIIASSMQPRKKVATPTFRHQFEFRHTHFAYPDKPDQPVLTDISLTVRKGEKVGIVGPSGGGKTTLVKILLGYYPLDKGMLYIDNKAVDNQSLTSLISYVPQDTTIFHRTIRENIAYAMPEASDDDIITAAKHAQAHDFIMASSRGYETLVGERGIKLSGGQRQRIAIARALLKNSPLLILDEATSALDSASESLIQAALKDLMKHKTAIVIAHRLSTIQEMDRIIVLDEGRIIEQGTHRELLSASGLYTRLWAHQSGGFIDDKLEP